MHVLEAWARVSSLFRGLIQTICGRTSVIMMFGGEVLDVMPSFYITKALGATFLSS